ncbi:hypothetical protein PORY_002509 [Pneumocystis oryctolagi]|uniref:Uncharacterized protein n=1 Tax=Pneumocystis oryctolagi TaxID=42067 RepID=A0ACB7C9M5_9ASCO|nr:hypothetical protein PORY_002509 [Pneumocystis oryctolagi]
MEDDYYALLGISSTANESQIHKGYRKAALQYHPDKNRDAIAVKMFHKISVAFDILSDPASRLEYDRSREALLAKKRKYEALDLERKRMVQDLERREGEAKIRKVRSETAMEETLRKLQEEGAALRKKREAALRAEREAQKERESAQEVSQSNVQKGVQNEATCEKSRFTIQDRTVKIRWRQDHVLLDKESISDAFKRFGKIEYVLLKGLADNMKKKKLNVALIVFESIVSAYAAVNEASLQNEVPFIHLKDVSWAKQAPNLEEVVKNISSKDEKKDTEPTEATSFLNQNGLDYENIILMRMRQAEREKLKKELSPE